MSEAVSETHSLCSSFAKLGKLWADKNELPVLSSIPASRRHAPSRPPPANPIIVFDSSLGSPMHADEELFFPVSCFDVLWAYTEMSLPMLSGIPASHPVTYH